MIESTFQVFDQANRSNKLHYPFSIRFAGSAKPLKRFKRLANSDLRQLIIGSYFTLGVVWQPDRGSNPDRLDQNQVCYHYTIGLSKAG